MKPEDRFDSLLQYWAARYALDWKLLKAQMLAESRGNPHAVSPVGAAGLMQFMPATFAEWWDRVYGVKGIPVGDRRDPDKSIELGAAYMRRLINQFGSFDTALASYNWGMGRVTRHLKQYGTLRIDALPKETRDYIRRIHHFREDLA